MKGEPIRHMVNTKRLSNITVYGACSNKLPELIFMTGTKTESQQWMKFLRILINHIQSRQMSKPYLILDNHPVHKAYAVRELYQHFFIMFLPSYSSHLNGIESCWNCFKYQ